ncbi:MAG: hypothetical protein AB7P04_02395 [Bacteriovoracia bacterium]
MKTILIALVAMSMSWVCGLPAVAAPVKVLPEALLDLNETTALMSQDIKEDYQKLITSLNQTVRKIFAEANAQAPAPSAPVRKLATRKSG